MQDNNKEEFKVPKSRHNSVASSKRPLPSANEELPTSAYEQALQDAPPSCLANLCLQQKREIDGLRGTIKRLEQTFNEHQHSRDEHVKNLEALVEEMADTIKRQASQQQSRDEHVKNLEARVEEMADTIKRQASQQQSRDELVKNLEARVEEMADTIKRSEQRFNDQQQSCDEHVKNLEARVDEMADTIKRQVSQQQSRDDHVKNLEGCLQQQEKEGGILKGHVNSMIGTIQHLVRCLTNVEFQIGGLRGCVETHLQPLTLRVNHQEHYLSNGYYIWKIENYEQRRQDAINGVKTDEFSPSIYTSRYGYELRLRICLNGVDSGVGRNIALFVQMVKGDYDDFLPWPFTGKITLSILDQSEGLAFRQHISKTLIAKPNLLAFQQPIAWCNSVCEGHGAMAPIEHIRDPQYIKNNTMLVCIHIEP